VRRNLDRLTTSSFVSQFKPTDAESFKRFLSEAATSQREKDLPALTGYWNRALQDSSNLYIYRTGDRILGAIQVGNEANALEVKLLQSIQSGVGTRLMQQAARISIQRGYQGRIVLNSYPESVGESEILIHPGC
jgi:ribosomal protein S18 acetylase RimI-like enzyme